MESAWLGGRTWRLCLKELRETLRDRRTVITLLLMPILVYPLLSLAMQRLLLSSVSKKGNTTYIIGVNTTQDGNELLNVLKSGEGLLELQPYQPIQIQRLLEPQQKGSEREGTGNGSKKEVDLPQFNVQVIERDSQEVLERGQVDLLVQRVGPGTPSSTAPSIIPLRFQLSYRQGDPISESALQQLQRVVQIINDAEYANRARARGRDFRGVLEMAAEPIRISNDTTAGLTTVIPLVLLLMTITGAVYPAIDLTAGERERGTMEALIASPVPRFTLLLSKYAAVVTVAVLTAVANLISMWVTLSVTGVGRVLFGTQGLSPTTMLQILPLLIVFACFFSAILLALCSFAKSFKEAQAYLIPVMLVALAPGIFSLMPGVRLTPALAVVPLVNMVLLSRDILTQSAEVLPAFAAVLSTLAYAAGVVSIAAKLFGSDATHHGGEGSWSELWTRPEKESIYPMLGQLFTYLALFYPIYFVATNLIGQQSGLTIGSRLWVNALVTCLLFLLFPYLFARIRNLRLATTFRLDFKSIAWSLAVPGIILLASSLWMVAHELFVLSMKANLATLSEEQIQLAKEAKEKLIEQPWIVVMLTSAILPAIAEEFFFRGFVLSSLHRLTLWRQILFSGLLFGLFHVLSGNSIALERLIPTSFLGIVLGWIAVRTGSLYPGILLHALHNGLLFTLVYQEEWLTRQGIGIDETSDLPMMWLVSGSIAIFAGGLLIAWCRKPTVPKEEAVLTS